ncbi:MAG TPA: ATP synthase F1 subunit delta [Alphaproteobacteria bacterium]|nr:ATP synthase F1 subunit delta [Alphaproteobacteria bacterium]
MSSNTASAKTSAAYARAFLEAADKQKKTAALLPQVAALAEVLSAPATAAQLADPRRGPKDRAGLVKGMNAKLKLPELLANLLSLLAANRRLGEAGAVLHAIVHLANARANRAEVRVETAAPFSPQQIADLKNVLKKKLKADDVLVTEVAAPELLGGFRAFTGGSVWDCSIKGRLSALAARFAHAIEK